MVNNRKIKLAGWLMLLSIVLLVLFQTYWLRKTYRDEFMSLRRELSLILRETTVRRQMLQMTADSNWRGSSRNDTARIVIGPSVNSVRDTSKVSEPLRMEVRMGVPLDTGTMRSRPRVITMEAERRSEAAESIREMVIYAPLFGETKNIKQVDTLYQKALLENEIDLNYTLRKLSRKETDSVITHDAQRISFSSRRNAQMIGLELLQIKFETPFWTIMGKMTWPLFFSFMMIGITIAAFTFLYRSLKAQHRLAVLKTDFISNITHELKTPIATVGVAIEALKNFNAMNDPARTREYLDISGNELHRLGLLVDKVLRLSMFEQDKMEIRKEQLSMVALVEEVMQSMKLQFEKAGAVVSLHASKEMLNVQGDKLHLLSVIYNLVDNALKYGQKRPAININLTKEGSFAKLVVQDDGIGIPAEFRKKVFDKFFRVPHGNTHNIKGYGLGLSYVAEVVKKHGGEISVGDAPEQGSSFVVTLPLVNNQQQA